MSSRWSRVGFANLEFIELEKPPLVPVFGQASWKRSYFGQWNEGLSSSCPCVGRTPELCGWSLWPGLLEWSVVEQIAMSMPTKTH